MNYEIKASVDSLGSGICLLCNAAFLVHFSVVLGAQADKTK